MDSERNVKTRSRFRRVSKARIFDGHPLKVGTFPLVFMVAVYVLMTAAISFLFLYFHEADFSLIIWTLLPGGLLGYFFLVMERWLRQLKAIMFPQMGKLLTAFLLFFFHTIGYLALSSFLFSYPLGYIMEKFWALPGLAAEYSLFSANFFIVLSILSWLTNVRTPPCKCL